MAGQSSYHRSIEKDWKSLPGFEETTPPARFKLARLPGPGVQGPSSPGFRGPSVLPDPIGGGEGCEVEWIFTLRTIPLPPATDRPLTPLFPHPCVQDNPRYHYRDFASTLRGQSPWTRVEEVFSYLPPPPLSAPTPNPSLSSRVAPRREGTFYESNLNKVCAPVLFA